MSPVEIIRKTIDEEYIKQQFEKFIEAILKNLNSCENVDSYYNFSIAMILCTLVVDHFTINQD